MDIEALDLVKEYNSPRRRFIRISSLISPLCAFVLSGFFFDKWYNWVLALMGIAMIWRIISLAAYACPNCGGYIGKSSNMIFSKKYSDQISFAFPKNFSHCGECGARLMKNNSAWNLFK